MILICLWRELNPEFICAGCALSPASAMYIRHLSYLKVQVVEDVVLYVRTVTTPETRKDNAFLAVISLESVKWFFILT
jgi:hypothetical protein